MTEVHDSLFFDALSSLDRLRPVLGHAREMELARLSAFLSGLTANVSRVESRLKDSGSIRENYVLYRGHPSKTVQIVELLGSVTDLIGLRVVVMYDSDVDIVVDHLSSSYGSSFEQVFTVADRTRGAAFGYRATHWKYPFQDGAFETLLCGLPVSCELQVRTILSDAWAQHSHKLTYKGPLVSPEDERVFARISSALEGLDAEIDRLAAGKKSIAFSSSREDLPLVLARQEAYDLLRDAVSSSIPDSAVGAVLEQAGAAGLVGPEDRTQFVGHVKSAVSYSKEGKLARYGIVDEITRLKIGFFWADRKKYVDLVPPHLKARWADMLLVG